MSIEDCIMRLKIALLCALLVPLGTAKADVVTLSNTRVINTSTISSLYIQLVTTGSGAFQLSSLTFLGGGAANNVVYMLTTDGTNAINGITGNATIDLNGLLTFAGAGLNSFGAGTSWLKVTDLNTNWDQSDSASLTKTGVGDITSGLITTGINSTVATGDKLFGVSLVVAVPEPATMILTGSALAVGAIGAYFKRRRKPQTEMAA